MNSSFGRVVNGHSIAGCDRVRVFIGIDYLGARQYILQMGHALIKPFLGYHRIKENRLFALVVFARFGEHFGDLGVFFAG